MKHPSAGRFMETALSRHHLHGGADKPPVPDSPPGTAEQMGPFDAQFQVIT